MRASQGSQGCNITSAMDFIRLIFLVNVRLDRKVFSNVTFDLLDVYFSQMNERNPVPCAESRIGGLVRVTAAYRRLESILCYADSVRATSCYIDHRTGHRTGCFKLEA